MIIDFAFANRIIVFLKKLMDDVKISIKIRPGKILFCTFTSIISTKKKISFAK